MQDKIPPEAAAVAAEKGIKQAEKQGYSVPPLATTLTEGRELPKKDLSQLQ
jgi:hypothetical protein